MHALSMALLGVATGPPQESGYGFFGNLSKPSRGPDTTAFIQMADDLLRFGLWELGIA
jgi:hypothetical protein